MAAVSRKEVARAAWNFVFLACLMAGVPARGTAGDNAGDAAAAGISDACKVAVEAVKFSLDQYLQLGGVASNDSYTNSDLSKYLLEQGIALEKAFSFPSKDLYTPFSTLPYLKWGNQRVQAAMSACVYVPTANLGEIMWVVSNITAESDKLPELQRMVDSLATTEIWSRAWYELADGVLDSVGGEGCPQTSDDLSCRSAVLRHINYVFMGQYPNPTSPEAIQRLQRASELFGETMSEFEQYSMKVYTTPFNNGSAEAQLRTIFVAPSGGDKVPTLLFWVPNDWVAEYAYMRYAIGALRRGYAVLIFEGPGGGLTPRVPPYMPMYRNSSEVVRAVLDAALADEDIARVLDTESIIPVGVESSGFMSGHACVDLGATGDAAACVLSPPMPSIVDDRRAIMLRRFYGPIANASREHPEWMPPGSEALQAALTDPEKNIYEPLLHDCPPDSGAAELFTTVVAIGGLLPASLYHVLSALGGGEGRDDAQKLLAGVYPAWQRAEISTDVAWDPARVEVPVLFTHGRDDQDYFIFNTDEVFKQLPEEVQASSQLMFFEPESGAALTGQRGASPVYEEVLYPFLLEQDLLGDARRRR